MAEVTWKGHEQQAGCTVAIFTRGLVSSSAMRHLLIGVCTWKQARGPCRHVGLPFLVIRSEVPTGVRFAIFGVVAVCVRSAS